MGRWVLDQVARILLLVELLGRDGVVVVVEGLEHVSESLFALGHGGVGRQLGARLGLFAGDIAETPDGGRGFPHL